MSKWVVLRNFADTFDSIFKSIATAARTYTLQDRDGVLADDTDLAGKVSSLSSGSPFMSVDSSDAENPVLNLDAPGLMTYTFNDQTDSYTLQLSDFAGDSPVFLRLTKTGAATVTVPPNATAAIPVGRCIIVKKVGTGDITFSPGAGVTIVPSNGAYTSAPNQQVVLLKEGTNSWGLYNGIAVDATSLGLVPNTRTIAAIALSADITVAALLAALGLPARTYVTGTDVTSTSTSFADVTGLSFAVTSGVKYEFRFRIPYVSSVSTEGSKWALNGPTVTYLQYDVIANNSTTARFFELSHNSYDPAVTASATTNTAVTGNNMVEIIGTIVPSANGTLVARFGCENGGANSITVKRNGYDSYYEFRIIP